MNNERKIHDDSLNSLLAQIELAADEATTGFRLLKRAAPYPVGAPLFGSVCRVANDAATAALTFLGNANAATLTAAASLQALSDRTAGLLCNSRTTETKKSTRRSLVNHPGWGMFMELGDKQTTQAAMILAGLLILQAAQDDRPIPKALANNLRKKGSSCDLTPESLRILLDSSLDAADTEWPWTVGIQTRWAHMLNVLTVGGASPPPPGFSRRARGQIFARKEYASPAHRAGTVTHRNLSKSQFLAVCPQVQAWVNADDCRGAYAIACAMTGLTVDLIPDLPLAGYVDECWVACLDIAAGTIKSDLTFLAPEAAVAPTSDVALPSDYVLEKPYPSKLASQLRARLVRFPLAKTLGDLYPEATKLTGDMSIIESRQEIKPSWARWVNSFGIYARQFGMDNLLAAIMSNDMGHIPSSKPYYASVPRSEIWVAAQKMFKACGWGSAEPDTGSGVAFGSRVVPTDAAIQLVINIQHRDVEAIRPPRNDRKLQRLLDFHNLYVRSVAFQLALLLGLREKQAYELYADIDEGCDLWVEMFDKSVPGANGAMPIALCKHAKELIKNLRRHCDAMAERLFRLGKHGMVLHEWLLAVVTQERVALLCRAISTELIERVGSGEAFRMNTAHLEMAPDAGRKWLENKLRHEGLRAGDVDAALRHDVTGQSHSSSTSDFVLLEWAVRVSTAIDRVATAVLGPVPHGLKKR